ncbi:GNAT family N-acetyltransferase [Ensifer sp. MJa1]|uniref:GNAT family N-acetyltransferase n=1 Tax=Ensifer sp. MJa1 TaxID=2919888 RepID=UPI00300B742E
MTKVLLRPALPGDEPYLRWLEEACMRDYAVALWGSWRPRPANALILSEHRIMVADEKDVGCVSLFRRDDHLWVNKLYVAPGHQKRGYGAVVLKQVMEEARAIGLPLRLSVLTTNPAVAFYRREGLRIYAETVERRYMTSEAQADSHTPPG